MNNSHCEEKLNKKLTSNKQNGLIKKIIIPAMEIELKQRFDEFESRPTPEFYENTGTFEEHQQQDPSYAQDEPSYLLLV